jgi:hypothetical protein
MHSFTMIVPVKWAKSYCFGFKFQSDVVLVSYDRKSDKLTMNEHSIIDAGKYNCPEQVRQIEKKAMEVYKSNESNPEGFSVSYFELIPKNINNGNYLSSNVCYPDITTFRRVCLVDEDFVLELLEEAFGSKCQRIGNKYVVILRDHLYYQHDDKTWLIEPNF